MSEIKFEVGGGYLGACQIYATRESQHEGIHAESRATSHMSDRYDMATNTYHTIVRSKFETVFYGDRDTLIKALHKAVLEAAEKHGVSLDEPVTA